MVRDFHLNVMMETMIMEMDAHQIVRLNHNSHAIVEVQTVKTYVQDINQQSYNYTNQVKLIYLERLY